MTIDNLGDSPGWPGWDILSQIPYFWDYFFQFGIEILRLEFWDIFGIISNWGILSYIRDIFVA